MYQKYFFYDISYIYDLCQIFGLSHLNFIHCPYNGVLLFYNITHRREFENIQKIAKNIEAEIKDNEKKAIIYLVGNKSNMKKEREVSKEEAIDFCNQYNYKYFECSALTGYNIHEMFSYITRDIIERDFNCNTKNK